MPERGRRHPTHWQRLEAESIHIMRETVAEAENPVPPYSIGKDSSAMLHLAMNAFYRVAAAKAAIRWARVSSGAMMSSISSRCLAVVADK